MSFIEFVDQITELLRVRQRIAYGTLKREFDLDEAALEDLKIELIHSKQIAHDEDDKVIVWNEAVHATISLAQNPVRDGREISSNYESPVGTPSNTDPQLYATRDSKLVGERKTITTLFADLQGSTALIEELDPEEAQGLIDPVLQLMIEAVRCYGGFVAQALGDGIFALFGAPIAHEDHAHRALYAALRMQNEIRLYSNLPHIRGITPLKMRVGINTGDVVVRSVQKDESRMDYVPVGYSTNLAARMEQKAAPGSIVVSENTRKLTDGFFKLKELGTTRFDGIKEPMNVYEVLGTGPLRTRLEVSARRGLTRFVGRDYELSRIRNALDQANVGHGQLFALTGDPGVGKSRLFHEFKVSSRCECRVLETFSVSHGKSLLYQPLIELFKSYFRLSPNDDEATRKRKVHQKILALDPDLEETIPYLDWLLGIETSNSLLRQMDPEIRRHRKFDALKRLLLRESYENTLILVFEDLHWLDNGTQAFLDILSKDLSSVNILLLVNYRPEYRHDWGSDIRYTEIRLAPLNKEEFEELLANLLGSDSSLSGLTPILLEKTQGSPFFAEEVVQTLAEEGVLVGERGNYRLDKTPNEFHIPPNIQGVLAARIDRLSKEEKQVLQQLSVIGKQFPLRLAEQVISLQEENLVFVLSSLQDKEFLYEQTGFSEIYYSFKHALTHDLVYRTLLQKQRKFLHEYTGRALETLYSDSLDEHYGELAHHYRHSDSTEKAIMYLGLAGQQAAQHSACSDAIEHLDQALSLLEELPDSPERKQQKVTFQTSLAVSLGAAEGYGSTEVEQALSRAQELCLNAEQIPQLSPMLYALRRLYMARGDLYKAEQLAEQHWQLAKTLDERPVRLLAHVSCGIISSGSGNFLRARRHFIAASRLYDERQHHALASLYGDDPGSLSRGYNALTLWALGYPDQALDHARESLRLAESLDHSLSLAWAQLFNAMVHQYRRESALTLKWSQSVTALSHEQGFPLFRAAGTVARGWAIAEQDEPETGIGLIHEGLEMYGKTGARLWQPYFLAILAETKHKAGQPKHGIPYLKQALAEVHKSHECQHEPELYRLLGELALATEDQKPIELHAKPASSARQESKPSQAEANFQHSINLARKQSAKSWELRSAISLARLWNRQNRSEEAYELLSPIYSWFTEGFNTPDLRDAKDLLEDLSESHIGDIA